MLDTQKFIEEIKALTVAELNDLVKAIEEEFGVSAAAMAVAAPTAGVAAAEGAPKTVKEAVAKEAANEMVEKFKAAGATAELK